METKKTFCTVCHANCALEVDIEDNRVLAVRGDRDDPMYRGFLCMKGAQIPELVHSPARIRTPLQRSASGQFQPLALTRSLDEIAAKLTQIISRNGARAVAAYCGTFAARNQPAFELCRSWLDAIGSPNFYTSATIDQPIKWYVSPYRHGVWGAGLHDFETSDVIMILGSNPLASMTPRILPPVDPIRRLKDARRAGLKVICIDPRRSDLAEVSTLHLQVRPGEDATLMAGLMREILAQNLQDDAFCRDHAEGLEDLRSAVEPFDLAYVAARTRVPADLISEAAALFGKGPRGSAVSGTGTEMSRHPSVTEHLIQALNTVCGRYKRAGETISNPGVFAPYGPRYAQAIMPDPPVHDPATMPRVRGLSPLTSFGAIYPPREMPTAALPDEILTPGEGQIRALLSVGGGPMTAIPNQRKVAAALDQLDLLVQVDIKMSPSARRAHYILPAKVTLEKADANTNMDKQYPLPYARFTEALITPNGELLEEWEFFWELAHRMRTPLTLAGGSVPIDKKPDRAEILSLAYPFSRVSFAELRRSETGTVYDFTAKVLPEPPGPKTRLRLAPADVLAELGSVRAEDYGSGASYGSGERKFTHRLISRRLRQAYNHGCQDLARSQAKGVNFAYMNPLDMGEIDAVDGDLVTITSTVGAIVAVARAAKDIPREAVSMAHAWGDSPDRDFEVRKIGSPTNRLVDDSADFDSRTGMPLQSAIPVSIVKVEDVDPIVSSTRPT